MRLPSAASSGTGPEVFAARPFAVLRSQQSNMSSLRPSPQAAMLLHQCSLTNRADKWDVEAQAPTRFGRLKAP